MSHGKFSELKWPGIDHVTLDNHKIFNFGQVSRRRNGVTIIISKESPNSVLGLQSAK